MKKLNFILAGFTVLTSYSVYADYVNIGTTPSGALCSINTNPRYFTKIKISSISDAHKDDIVYRFWNKVILNKPHKMVFCDPSTVAFSCVNKTAMVKKVIYLSVFNLTTNTYCDEQSQYYDKYGSLIFKSEQSCNSIYSNFADIQPDGDNDFISSRLPFYAPGNN